MSQLFRNWTVVILAVLILGGAYFFYKYGQNRKANNFLREYQTATELHQRGEYDSAINKLQEAMKYAPTKDEQEKVIWKLANSLIYRSASGDRLKAINLFKEVAADQSRPPSSRAFSLNGLAFVYDLTQDEQLVREQVFNEPPFLNYLSGSKTGIEGALRRIYEQADELSPNALSKIEIAFRYAAPLEEGRLESGLTSQHTAELIKKYLSDATPLLAANYEADTLAYLHLIRARSLDSVYASTKNVELKDVESAYEKALSLAQNVATDDFEGTWLLNWARIWYAGALAKYYGGERANDVSSLLEPLVAARPPYSKLISLIHSSLRRLNEAPPARRKTYIALASVNTKFGKLLLELGWDLSVKGN